MTPTPLRCRSSSSRRRPERRNRPSRLSDHPAAWSAEALVDRRRHGRRRASAWRPAPPPQANARDRGTDRARPSSPPRHRSVALLGLAGRVLQDAEGRSGWSLTRPNPCPRRPRNGQVAPDRASPRAHVRRHRWRPGKPSPRGPRRRTPRRRRRQEEVVREQLVLPPLLGWWHWSSPPRASRPAIGSVHKSCTGPVSTSWHPAYRLDTLERMPRSDGTSWTRSHAPESTSTT